MKKVLHVTMSNAYGGAETVIFSIVDGLNNEYSFEYLCPGGKIERLLINKNIRYKTLNSKSIKEISKKIEEIKPDIIHAHDFTASVLCGIATRKVPVISHLHTSHNWIKGINIKSLIYSLVAIRLKKIIVVSKSMIDEIVLPKFLRAKVQLLINPIDVNKINILSNEYNVNAIYDLAFLGRLSEYKNPKKFIKIIDNLKRSGLITKSAIVGDGELREECVNYIKELELNKEIEMKGFVENPFPILKNTRVLVMPSKVEAFGLSAIQAMSLGKPVIASNIGGLRDIINSENGRLCDSIEGFIKEIEEVLNNSELYNYLSVNAINNAKKIDNIDFYISEIRKIYN